MTPEEFRQCGHRLIDWLADYHQHIGELPVMAAVRPGAIKGQLPAEPPPNPESMGAILDDLDRIVLAGITHWQHPRFFGYFPANALFAGMLGDFLSSGLGILGLSWQASPAVTEIEEVATDW